MMGRRSIKDLHVLRERIEKSEQSANNENELVKLNWHIEEEELNQRIMVIRLAKILYEACWKTGEMQVILADGSRVVDRPVHSESAIQRVWNARSKAEHMAEIATVGIYA